MSSSAATCCLCDRHVSKLTKHHLIPRTQHKYYRLKKGYSRDQLNQTVPLCPACHKNLHAAISEKELASAYNTVGALQHHPEISKFTEWVRTKRGNLNVSFRKRRR
ncbi:MAG: hypothetical protein AAF974_10365 [Cyanobacteria bacterium P01_E01_bin.34]